jgi:hypothetical protein
MKTILFIDNNVWDIFFEKKLNIKEELGNIFELFITREAKLEIDPMPNDLKRYVYETISNSEIKTDLIFGFKDNNKPVNKQSVGLFGDKFNLSVKGGRFISSQESKILQNEKHLIGDLKEKTYLYKNEADIALAARAEIHFILTCDSKKALKRAKNVINLRKWDNKIKISDFIINEIMANKKG